MQGRTAAEYECIYLHLHVILSAWKSSLRQTRDTGIPVFLHCSMCEEMTGPESDTSTWFGGFLCEVPEAEINSRTASDSFGQLRTDSTNLKGLRVFQYIPVLRFFVLVVCVTCRSWQLLDWNFLIRRECQRERIYANASQRMDPRVLFCMLYIIGLPCLISWYFLIFWNESFRSFYSLNWP